MVNKVEILKYCVGVDVAKDKLAVTIVTIDRTQTIKIKASSSFDNTLSGLRLLSTWITKHHHKEPDVPISVLMEATGVYHENCALFFYKQGMKVSVVLPNVAKKFIESINTTKNDKKDGEALARMGAERNVNAWQPISANVYEIRTLTRYYQSTDEDITQSRNQLHALEHSGYAAELIKEGLLERIKFLNCQKDQAEATIHKLVKQDPALNELAVILASAHGVGMLTASVLLAETNGFQHIDNERQLTSYAGYDVVENQSGNKNGKTRISKRGNSHIRRGMYMPALTVVRDKVQPFYALYERVLAKTKIKMKALVAVQRKLLSILFAMVKKKEMFVRDFKPNWNNEVVDDTQKTLREDGAGSLLFATSHSDELCVV